MKGRNITIERKESSLVNLGLNAESEKSSNFVKALDALKPKVRTKIFEKLFSDLLVCKEFKANSNEEFEGSQIPISWKANTGFLDKVLMKIGLGSGEVTNHSADFVVSMHCFKQLKGISCKWLEEPIPMISHGQKFDISGRPVITINDWKALALSFERVVLGKQPLFVDCAYYSAGQQADMRNSIEATINELCNKSKTVTITMLKSLSVEDWVTVFEDKLELFKIVSKKISEEKETKSVVVKQPTLQSDSSHSLVQCGTFRSLSPKSSTKDKDPNVDLKDQQVINPEADTQHVQFHF